MSLRPSVRTSGLVGNMIFSAHNRDRVILFSVHIPLIYEHLFYKYFDRQSVGQATKNVKTWKCVLDNSKQLRYLWMLSSLFPSNQKSFTSTFSWLEGMSAMIVTVEPSQQQLNKPVALITRYRWIDKLRDRWLDI